MDPAGDATQGPSVAIFHPPGRMSLKANPFGKDVANLQLWRALARHGGYGRIDVFGHEAADPAAIAHDLFGDEPAAAQVRYSILGGAQPVDAGVLLRGTPGLYELAWLRRSHGSDRAHSLVGLIHTVAPPAMRQIIAMTAVAPMHPWDALICTSPVVRDNMEAMFRGWGEHLAERTGGAPPPHPRLPVIPLGVDLAAFEDRPGFRAAGRGKLGLGDDDILVLWVGRLSYFEKAFPQPMFRAVEMAQAATGARVTFVMAGWFPEEPDRARYEEAARLHAPGVDVRFVDGNDRASLGELWAAADIFLSLVDNIQETFGITPLEAMAAGLPVVASDWDGYRFTVRHGVEGFLAPTLGAPPAGGRGQAILERHLTEAWSYQTYVAAVAQHTAVHIGRAAEALEALIRSPDLRRRMGAAGRRRVAEAFDWPVVIRQVRALTDELAEVRGHATDSAIRHRTDPVKGDPFRDFAAFSTHALGLDTRLTPGRGSSAEQIRGVTGALDTALVGLRAPPELCAQAYELIAESGGATVREVLTAFPVPQRRALEMGLAWMAKYGFVDWLG